MSEENENSGSISITPGSLRPSDYMLDHFVAPELSRFNTTSLPDLSDGDHRWINRFILNSVFGVKIASPHRALLLNVCRRSEAAFDEYGLASLALAELAGASRTTFSPYFRALRHLEAVIANVDAGWTLAAEVLNQKAFDPTGESPLKRLRWLYNDSKHAEERLRNGKFPPESTLVVWLTNAGLRSKQAELGYVELATLMGQLEDMATQAATLSAEQGASQDGTEGV